MALLAKKSQFVPAPINAANLYNFKVSVTWPQSKIGDIFCGWVNIENKGDKPFPGGRIHIQENEYFYPTSAEIPAVPAFNKKWAKDVQLTFEPKEHSSIRTLPSNFRAYITSTDKKIVFVTAFTNQMNFFLKGLREIKPKTVSAYNILLFGFAGATKTSFLNTCFTMASDEVVKAFRQGGASGHVTNTITPVYLKPYDQEKASKLETEFKGSADSQGEYAIRLWDVWGLTQQNTYDGVLEKLISGELPGGWTMANKLDDLQLAPPEYLKKLTASKHEREIHCVLFFCPQAVLNDPNQKKYREQLSQYFSEISKKGDLNPLLLLTKVDEEEPEVRKHPMGHFPKLEELKKTASALLNIPVNRIFYNVNYYQSASDTDFPEKSFELDQLTYSILLRAVENAKGTYFAKYEVL